MSWFTYILACSDGSYYVGHTEDAERRLSEHNLGRGAAYTACRRPVLMVYREMYETKKEAILRELQIKKWSKAKKAALISGDMSRLHHLAKRRT